MIDVAEIIDAFSQELRHRRQALGLTLEEYAARAGLTPNYIGAIELGKRDPSLSTIMCLAHGFGISVRELFGGRSKLSATAVQAGRVFDTLPHKVQHAFLAIMHAYVDVKKRRS